MSGRNASRSSGRGTGSKNTDGTAGAGSADAAAVYADLRPLMFSIAYRMLGSVTEAEDIVQEAFLRYHRAVADNGPPDSPKAYLSAVDHPAVHRPAPLGAGPARVLCRRMAA